MGYDPDMQPNGKTKAKGVEALGRARATDKARFRRFAADFMRVVFESVKLPENKGKLPS